jgi:quercetin dioxygenase-like cupin family protein
VPDQERPTTVTPIRAGSERRTETPNGTMTTLASPTQGQTMALSLWRVEMQQGHRSPRNVVDVEEVWHVLRGEVAITVGEQAVELTDGDTLVIPENVARHIAATADAIILVCGFGDALLTTTDVPTTPGTPPWIG